MKIKHVVKVKGISGLLHYVKTIDMPQPPVIGTSINLGHPESLEINFKVVDSYYCKNDEVYTAVYDIDLHDEDKTDDQYALMLTDNGFSFITKG